MQSGTELDPWDKSQRRWKPTKLYPAVVAGVLHYLQSTWSTPYVEEAWRRLAYRICTVLDMVPRGPWKLVPRRKGNKPNLSCSFKASINHGPTEQLEDQMV